MGMLLLLVLILLLLGALPRWPYSHTWGYQPAVIIGVLLAVLLLLALSGRMVIF
jgi:hypothetical protein